MKEDRGEARRERDALAHPCPAAVAPLSTGGATQLDHLQDEMTQLLIENHGRQCEMETRIGVLQVWPVLAFRSRA